MHTRSLLLHRVQVALLCLAFLCMPALDPAHAQEWEQPTEERQKLADPVSESGDHFGSSVAISGDVAVVGARNHDDNGDDSGAVLVYRYDADDTNWDEEQKLTASDGDTADRFGTAVSIRGSLALIGAPDDDDDGTDSGSAYFFLYDEDDDLWTEEQKLTAEDASGGDEFGFAIAMDGQVALVAAYRDDEEDPNAGAVYVFRYDATDAEWIEEQKLTASDGSTVDEFGRSVAISGDVAVIGAPQDSAEGFYAGSVYIFRYDPDSEEWTEEQKLNASDADEGDEFGGCVAISGPVVVIGARNDDDDGPLSGAAYVFRHDDDEAEWVEEQKLTASDADAIDRFGRSVAVSGDRVLVGAPRDIDSGTSSGSAYVFGHDPEAEEWLETFKLTASDGAERDEFGGSVAADGSLLVVGAALSDVGDDLDVGSAYVFHLGEVFLRGDVDGNGRVSALADGLTLLCWGFQDCDTPPCLDAADADDNGDASPLTDALYLFFWAFASGPAPGSPGPDDCGVDPTADEVDCREVTRSCL